MTPTITAFYAAIFALFALYLSARAGLYRSKAGVSILFGEPVDQVLAERVRVHQNFLEYVPMAIIMMGLLEASGGSAVYLHAMGVLLLAFRIAHRIGLKHDNIAHPGRAIGAAGTALLTVATAGYLLVLSVPRLIG
jgi:uncharacterized membrane protein YecN with MAPEG domain